MPDCACAVQRKAGRLTPFDPASPFSPVRFADEILRNTGIFAYFAAKGGAVSLRFRLAGGAGSLALTFLCPNSLLTGNLTGNLANSGALKPHFLSLSYTFQKETSVQA